MSKERQYKHVSPDHTDPTVSHMSLLQPKVQPKIYSRVQPKYLSGFVTNKPEEKVKPSSVDLPQEVQAKMETSFGQDFSDVAIRKDSYKAEELNARAYTQGNEIHFAPGQFNPASQEGQELIGHELTHVVQQRNGKVGPGELHGSGIEVNQDAMLEKEADELGKRAASGKSALVEGTGAGIQKQTAPSGPTEEELDRIVQRYNEMIAGARKFGYNVAADNLQHFLDGSGADRTLSSTWLRDFGVITSAEDVNHKRFQKSLIKLADTMKDGETKGFVDYWDRGLYATGMNELFYASGGSTITSRGNFTLTCKGKIVTISGFVNHHWHDPYDWHAGLSAPIPGFGNVSDADALLLQQHRGARSFEMVSDWQHTLSGTVEINRWTDYFGTDFTWTLK